MDLYNIISTQSRHPAPRSVWGHIHEYSEPFLWRRVIVEIGCVICYSCVKILPITLSPGGDSGVAFQQTFYHFIRGFITGILDPFHHRFSFEVILI